MFAKRLKAEREKRKAKDPKWTQGYVADRVGVARSTYTAYEAGTKQPPMETLSKLADLFNVSTDYLHGKTNDPSPTDKKDNATNLTDEERRVLNEMKKYPVFFNDLASDPSKIKKVIKMWEFIKEDLENDDDEEPQD